MGIGRRIKEAREAHDLTQKELGKLVGVTGSAITNYENETSHPKESVLYALFKVLAVDANFLFQDCMLKKDAPEISPEGKYGEIIKLLDDLRPEQLAEVRGYIKRMIEDNEAAETAKQINEEAI